MNAKTCAGVLLLSLATLASPLSAVAAQSGYPERPVRILIPFPAGGGADVIGRTIGEPLAVAFGQPVVMDNRPGAAGRLATEMLVRAEPDGHTLLVGGVGPLAISPSLYRKLPYDVTRDFLPITRVAEIINVIVVHPASGVGTVAQLVEWAKKHSGDMRYGTSGLGQLDHLVSEFFQKRTGIRMTPVAYKGNGPALIDLIAGDLQVMFPPYVTVVPHVRSGRLRALAVTTPQRQALLPELPTVGETLPGFGVQNWNGIFAPAKVSPAVADRLFTAINTVLLSPEVKARQNAVGIEPVGSPSRAAFTAFLREDTQRWARIIRDARIQLE